MRTVWMCVLVVACASAPKAQRLWYVMTSGTFDGEPTTSAGLDVSYAGETVFLLRSAADRAMSRQGFGIRRSDGVYDVAFYRQRPRVDPFYPRGVPDDMFLIVIGADGRGKIVFPDRYHALRAIDRGTTIHVDAPTIGHITVELGPGASATVKGRLSSDILVAASGSGDSTDLTVGRYDFTHGHGENVGMKGRGSETIDTRAVSLVQ